jgi:hypothetical protein
MEISVQFIDYNFHKEVVIEIRRDDHPGSCH